MPLQPGDFLPVTIESIAFGGEGVARHEGQVLFVPFAAAGDRAEVRIDEARKNFARATLVRVLEPGRGRAAAPCPYYGSCGGCQYQHLDYAEELRLKEAQVGETLRRIGRIEGAPLLPVLPSPQIYGYRNRITVHAAPGKIGFHRAGSREVVDIGQCALAMPEVNEALFALRRRRPAEGHFSLRHPGLPPSAFHQINQFLLEPLRDLVAAWAQGEETRLVEGYCGGGFFTSALAPHFASGAAIEADPRGLRDARRLGLSHIAWIEGKVEDHLSAALGEEGAATLVLLDPPREGLDGRATAALLDRRPRRILYVSCNPATLARDLEKLSSAYVPARIQPVDLFPRTAQIETVTELRLK